MLLISTLGYNLLQQRKEGFDTKSTAETVFWVILAVYLFLAFLWSYGAAKLSFGYNYYLGNSYGTSFLFSFLAFIFSELYYPMYAYFLNPIYNIRKKNI